MMQRFRFQVLTVVVSALSIAPSVSFSQIPAKGLYTVILPEDEFGSALFTKVVVDGMAAARQFCGALNEAYRVDCLAERFASLAKLIPDDTEYVEVRDTIQSASNKLEKLATSNKSSALPTGRAQRPSSPSEVTSRPLTPVAETATASVNGQAIAIIEEAETILLRSAESSQRRKVHYAQVVDAIGSNKVLLRST
jgi:hypothetical protein